jgi:hypothetical protein
MGMASTRERTTANTNRVRSLLVTLLATAGPSAVSAFCRAKSFHRAPTSVHSMPSMEDDMLRQIARAKELVKKSKAKLAAQEQAAQADAGAPDAAARAASDESFTSLPFFANAPSKRDQVTKSTDGNGLITIDGEKMARLSEDEEWEARPFDDVFKSESDQTKIVNEALSERDVAASMYNLRVTLQNEDFKAIFNERNRFIGEAN